MTICAQPVWYTCSATTIYNTREIAGEVIERLRCKAPAVRQCPPDTANRSTQEVSTIWLPKQDYHNDNIIGMSMWTWEISHGPTPR